MNYNFQKRGEDCSVNCTVSMEGDIFEAIDAAITELEEQEALTSLLLWVEENTI